MRVSTAQGITYAAHCRCAERKDFSRRSSVGELDGVFNAIMLKIAPVVLRRFDPELFTFGIDGYNFYFLVTLAPGQSIVEVMNFVKNMFSRNFKRHIEHRGPFWVEPSTYEIVGNDF